MLHGSFNRPESPEKVHCANVQQRTASSRLPLSAELWAFMAPPVHGYP